MVDVRERLMFFSINMTRWTDVSPWTLLTISVTIHEPNLTVNALQTNTVTHQPFRRYCMPPMGLFTTTLLIWDISGHEGVMVSWLKTDTVKWMPHLMLCITTDLSAFDEYMEDATSQHPVHWHVRGTCLKPFDMVWMVVSSWRCSANFLSIDIEINTLFKWSS